LVEYFHFNSRAIHLRRANLDIVAVCHQQHVVERDLAAGFLLQAVELELGALLYTVLAPAVGYDCVHISSSRGGWRGAVKHNHSARHPHRGENSTAITAFVKRAATPAVPESSAFR